MILRTKQDDRQGGGGVGIEQGEGRAVWSGRLSGEVLSCCLSLITTDWLRSNGASASWLADLWGEGGGERTAPLLSLSLCRANNNYEAVAVIKLEQLKCTTLTLWAGLNSTERDDKIHTVLLAVNAHCIVTICWSSSISMFLSENFS